MPHTVFLSEHHQSLYKGLISGAFGGIVISIVGQPFDNIKFRLQTNNNYKGTFDCLNKIIKTEGSISLFRGLSLSMSNQILFRSTLFLTQSETKKYLANGNENKIWHYFVAGSIGWGIGSIFECPFDVIRLQLQKKLVDIKPNQIVNIQSCTQELWKNGLKTFYLGYTSHLIRNVLAGGIHLGSYDIIRENIAKYKNINIRDIKIHENLLAGALSGVIFWSVVYPIDTIKSNLQSDNVNKRNFKGIIDCTKKLVPIKNLYKGIVPCIIRAIPANSLMLYVVTIMNERFFN